jgi:hypothetical protein
METINNKSRGGDKKKIEVKNETLNEPTIIPIKQKVVCEIKDIIRIESERMDDLIKSYDKWRCQWD